MIIELVGPPCSGKSTLAQMLEKEHGFTRIKIKNNFELVFLNMFFIIKYPIFSIETFFLIMKESKTIRLFYYKFTNIFLHHNARYEKAKQFEHAVIDEGLTHNILSIFEKPLLDKDVLSYLKKIPLVDKVLLFRTNKKTLYERASRRGYLARENFLNKNEQEEWFSSILKNTETLIKNSSLIGNACIIDGNKSGEEIKTEALSFLQM